MISILLLAVVAAVMLLVVYGDKRRARRKSDPVFQPERTSLARFAPLLGYGALMAPGD